MTIRSASAAPSSLFAAAVMLIAGACGAAQPPAGPERAAATAAPVARTTAAMPGEEAVAVTPAPPAEPEPVRYAGQSSASDAGIFVAMERGYFLEQGVRFEYVPFASASEMVPALATRQMEAAGLAVNAATINAVARGIEIKAVADKGSLPPGFGWEAFLVRKELVDSGRFRDATSLRGLVFASTPPINAGASFPPLQRVLASAGLTESDLRLEAISFPEINAALAGGSVDAAFQLEPLVTAAVEQGIATRWLGVDEVYPYQQVAVLGYGPSIGQDQPALGHAIMRAYLKGLRDYNRAFRDGIGKAEIAAIIAKHSTVKNPAVVEAMTPVGLDPDGRINVDSLIEDQRFYVEKGTVPTPVDMHQLVDHSYVEAALRALGPAQ